MKNKSVAYLGGPISDWIKDNLKYDPDTGKLWWIKEGRNRVTSKPAGGLDDRGYIAFKFGGKKHYAHRLAFLLMGEPIPRQVDHINGVRDDNRWCNLRPACHSTNQQNKKFMTNNTSGYRGVYWDKGAKKWRAVIGLKGKINYLGLYDCPKEAYKTYCKAADKYFGEFANYEKLEKEAIDEW